MLVGAGGAPGEGGFDVVDGERLEFDGAEFVDEDADGPVVAGDSGGGEVAVGECLGLPELEEFGDGAVAGDDGESVVGGAAGAVSDDLESNRDSDRVAQAVQVSWIAAHDEVAASRCSDDNGGIDHIGCSRSSTRRAGRSSTGLVEWLDAATRQQTRHLSLRSTPPALRQDSRWNRRNDPALKRTTVQGPDSSVVSLGSDERAGVVGQAAGHGSRRHSTGRTVEDRVGPGQLLVGQVAVFVLPCLNRSKAVFDDESASGSGVEPGGEAQPVALSSTCGSLRD